MNTYIHFSFFFWVIHYYYPIYSLYTIGNDPKERKNIILSFLWVIPFHILLLTTIIKDNIT